MPEGAPQKVNSVQYQKDLVREISGKIGSNSDFISVATYHSIFSRFDLKGKKIIDVGSGFIPISSQAAPYTKGLPAKGLTLVPVDINELRAKSWHLANPTEPSPGQTMVRPVQGDMFKLPFKDDSFDGGVSINTLNIAKTTEQAVEILMEIHRVLKPGGFLILSSFGYYEFTDGEKLYHNNDFTEDEMIDGRVVGSLARNLGFSGIENINLDPEKIKAEERKVAEAQSHKLKREVKAKAVLPFGLLLRK